MQRGRGLFPSPPSKDDVDTEQLLGSGGTPPLSVEGLLPLVRIKDQSTTQTCVWFAIAQAAHVYLKNQDPKRDVWLSPMFGYYNTLKAQGRAIADLGCIPRVALQVFTEAGFCDDADWPFDPAKVLHQPLPDAYTQANDQKLITNYYRLYGTGEDLVMQIKMALAAGHPVIYGSPIDDGYEAHDGRDPMGPPTGKWNGSHMRCLVGYTKDFAIEANSWSTGWGDNGFGLISWEFIKWGYCHDFWVFSSVPVPTG